MKYENHKDHKNYDFAKYEIDIDSVVKYYDNDKNSTMDKLEEVLKDNEVVDVIHKMEEEE